MTRLLILLAVLAASVPALASQDVFDEPFSTSVDGPRAVLRVSRSHGLWNFACALINREPGDEQALAQLFEASRFNDAHHADLLRRYRAACADSQIWSKVAAAAAKAKSLPEFYARLPQALNDSSSDPATAARNAELLRGVLKELAPVYDELIWKPSLNKIRMVQRRMVDLSRKTDFSALFSRAAAFYGASYNGPLLVALAPIPGGSGGRQPILGDVFLFEIPLTARSLEPGQLASSYGVIFHEMCHILHRQVPAATRKRMLAIAGDSKHADGVLNEALALAMGSWAERAISGSTTTWVGGCSYDARTCALTEALASRIADYLAAKRPLDDDFAAFAKEQYARLPAEAPALDEPALEAALRAAVDFAIARPHSTPEEAIAAALASLRHFVRYDSGRPSPRGPHEWSGRRALAAGTVNGCVESAKAFFEIFHAAFPKYHAVYLHAFNSVAPGGHAVVEVTSSQGRALIVDAASFEQLPGPVRLDDESLSRPVDIRKEFSGQVLQAAGRADLYLRKDDGRYRLTVYPYGQVFDGNALMDQSFATREELEGAVASFMSSAPADYAQVAASGLILSYFDAAKTGFLYHNEDGGLSKHIVYGCFAEPPAPDDAEEIEPTSRENYRLTGKAGTCDWAALTR
jgi:hypothetical protein